MKQRRTFGRSQAAISRIGFGAWAAGGPGWSYSGTPARADESVGAMLRAVELGVAWVDTAASNPIYGHKPLR